MEPLEIALLVLVVVGVWALVELALTIRKTRNQVEDLSGSVTDTLAEIKPVVQKLDGVADELEASSKQLDPLMEKAGTTLDAASLSLIHLDGILQDVETVTGAGAAVSDTVSKFAGTAAQTAADAVRKIAGKDEQARLEAKDTPAKQQEKVPEHYYTYPGSDDGAKKSKPVADAAADPKDLDSDEGSSQE